MAYSALVTNRKVGPAAFEVTIAETDCGPTDEASITGIPIQGRILKQVCVPGTGTAATVDPILGSETNPTGTAVIVEPPAAAAEIDIQGLSTYISETGVLYHRSRPNAGNDNVITTVYHIASGW